MADRRSTREFIIIFILDMLKILVDPNPKLRKKSKRVTKNELGSASFQDFIRQLSTTMQEADGIGIAAPQVGQNIRLIVINTDQGPQPMINPVVLWKSLTKELGEEGCLSVPGIFGLVKRAKIILLTYVDWAGKRHQIRAKGLFARVIQHEVDHLDGILFIDKAEKVISNKDLKP